MGEVRHCLLPLALLLAAGSVEAGDHVVKKGESLWSIARAQQGAYAGASVSQIAWAVVRANPEAFPDGPGKLKRGVSLLLPSESTVAETASAIADEKVALFYSAFGQKTPGGLRVVTLPPAEPVAEPTPVAAVEPLSETTAAVATTAAVTEAVPVAAAAEAVPVQAIEAATGQTGAEPAPADSPAPPAAAVPTEVASASPAVLVFEDSYGPRKAEDTLWSIAKIFKTQRPGASVAQIAWAIYRASPAAFIKQDPNRLRPNAILNVPELDYILAVDRKLAHDYIAGNKPLPPPDAPAAQSAPVAASPGV